jgi:wyosine [tRNA(Phe)-imidazoG37] synthetase (radical SAM superfamily)
MASREPVPAFEDHRRNHGDLLYVYPVVSRRAGGLSIGINLNPDKVCNFACAYCQVDHQTAPRTLEVDLDILEAELRSVVAEVVSGALWTLPRFSATPVELRRLNDFAFSGDGEPTTCKLFDQAVERVVAVRDGAQLDESKLVLITDSACLHHEHVRRGLDLMAQARGEVWGKLDVGTAKAYARINRTMVPFERVLENLARTASERSLVIQTMMLRIAGEGPPSAELEAYIGRLQKIEARGELSEVHVYTIARAPMEPWCTPLSDSEVDAIVRQVAAGVRARVRGFYGPPEGAR